jgi:electron transport complex protein RnfB
MSDDNKLSRQEFLNHCGRGLLLLALGGGASALVARKAKAGGTLWQIDPNKCTQCGKCATDCVLDQSAVRCFHAYDMCGYCDLCTGYFGGQPGQLNEGAENQVCPTNAIERTFVEDPYFQYKINENRCIGCAKCVEGCKQFGNGSLYMQIRQDKCVNCNQCSIAAACPAKAIVRVPADQPYISRHGQTS